VRHSAAAADAPPLVGRAHETTFIVLASCAEAPRHFAGYERVRFPMAVVVIRRVAGAIDSALEDATVRD
jgi:hypothetical protein